MDVYMSFAVSSFLSFLFSTDAVALNAIIHADVHSYQLTCEDNLTVNIMNITVEGSDCKTQQCIVTEDNISMFKKKCRNTSSCELDMNMAPSCIHDYSHFNLSYTCNLISDYSCNFQHMCGWEINPMKKFTWIRKRRKDSDQTHTVPYFDHTFGSKSGYYIYINSKDGKINDTSTLSSGEIVPSDVQCLTFWHYIGQYYEPYLRVYTRNKRQSTDNIHFVLTSWEKTFNWTKVQLELNESSIFNVVFEVTKRGRDGEMALDDISIVNTPCNVEYYDCDFETESCTWQIETIQEQYQWTQTEGFSNNRPTGPSWDHTTGSYTGHFMYLKSDVVPQTPKMAVMRSQNFTISQEACFTFWYHMYGSTMGSLNVYLEVDGHINKTWNVTGNQRDTWHQAALNINTEEVFVIKFEGIRGNGINSDIALDDIMLTPGTCAGTKSHSESCVDVKAGTSVKNCTNYYLNQTTLSFEPTIQNCSHAYMKANEMFRSSCDETNVTDNCKVNISAIISEHPTCFQSNTLRVDYACESSTGVTDEPTESSTSTKKTETSTSTKKTETSTSTKTTETSTHKIDSITGTQITDVTTETTKQETETINMGTTQSAILESSNDIATPVGVVVGLLIAVCAGIAIFIIIRRRRNNICQKEGSQPIKEKSPYEYIGHQDIPLSDTHKPNAPEHCDTQVRNNNQYCIDLTTKCRISSRTVCDSIYTEIEIDQDPTDNNTTIKSVTSTERQRQFMCVYPDEAALNSPPVAAAITNDLDVSDNHSTHDGDITDDDEYAVIEPESVSGFDQDLTQDEIIPTSDYTILDPNETGHNRSANMDSSDIYEFAKPINAINNGDSDNDDKHLTEEDTYIISEDGTYDSCNNVHHTGDDSNLYSHAIDSVYDTVIYERKFDDKEDTYDHFFSDTTEDD